MGCKQEGKHGMLTGREGWDVNRNGRIGCKQEEKVWVGYFVVNVWSGDPSRIWQEICNKTRYYQ